MIQFTGSFYNFSLSLRSKVVVYVTVHLRLMHLNNLCSDCGCSIMTKLKMIIFVSIEIQIV